MNSLLISSIPNFSASSSEIFFVHKSHVAPPMKLMTESAFQILLNTCRVTNHPPTATWGKGGIGRPWRPD